MVGDFLRSMVLLALFSLTGCDSEIAADNAHMFRDVTMPIGLARGGVVEIHAILLDDRRNCFVPGTRWTRAIVPGGRSFWSREDRIAIESANSTSDFVGYELEVTQFDPPQSEGGGQYSTTRTPMLQRRHASLVRCPGAF